MLTRWVLKTWPAILIFSLLIGAASVPRMIQLYRHISTDPIDLLPQDHPNVQTLIQVRQKVENRTRVTLVLESEKPEATIRYMKELVGRLEKEPFIEKVQYLKPGYAFFDKYKLLFLDLKDLTLIRDRID
ncbi:MAG: hypothetical protein HY542_03745, partial [Deltaproteobacteria bacterium]|nr:hypothetical protein [Deltaproteobacteria bacterium]